MRERERERKKPTKERKEFERKEERLIGKTTERANTEIVEPIQSTKANSTQLENGHHQTKV